MYVRIDHKRLLFRSDCNQHRRNLALVLGEGRGGGEGGQSRLYYVSVKRRIFIFSVFAPQNNGLEYTSIFMCSSSTQ
jgi:hypothetical protein